MKGKTINRCIYGYGLLLAAVLMIGVTCLFGVVSAERGPLGDGFGALSAVFSGLAFAGMIITLTLQGKELELQRQELKDTREVFEEQKKEMTEQSLSLKRQTFEETFFKLLDYIWKVDYRAESLVSEAALVLCCRGYSDRLEISGELDRYGCSEFEDEGFYFFSVCVKEYLAGDKKLTVFFDGIVYLVKLIQFSCPSMPEFYIGLLSNVLRTDDILVIMYYMQSDASFSMFAFETGFYRAIEKDPSYKSAILYSGHYRYFLGRYNVKV